MTVVNQGLVCNNGDVKVQDVYTGEKRVGGGTDLFKVPILVTDNEHTSLGMITRRINPTSHTSFDEIKALLKPATSVPFQKEFIEGCIKAHCGIRAVECSGVQAKMKRLLSISKRKNFSSPSEHLESQGKCLGDIDPRNLSLASFQAESCKNSGVRSCFQGKSKELFKAVSNINLMACVVRFNKPILKAIIQKNAKGKVNAELLDRFFSNAEIVGRSAAPTCFKKRYCFFRKNSWS